MRVDRVAVFFLPRNAELNEAFTWSEPYQEQIAVDALNRGTAIKTLTAGGPSVLGLLPTADAFCTYCPYFLPAVTDLTQACPGHTQTSAGTPPAAATPAA
jgi:hypothetical protein